MRNLNQLFLWGRIVNSNGILMYFMVRKTPFSGCKMLFSDVKNAVLLPLWKLDYLDKKKLQTSVTVTAYRQHAGYQQFTFS